MHFGRLGGTLGCCSLCSRLKGMMFSIGELGRLKGLGTAPVSPLSTKLSGFSLSIGVNPPDFWFALIFLYQARTSFQNPPLPPWGLTQAKWDGPFPWNLSTLPELFTSEMVPRRFHLFAVEPGKSLGLFFTIHT